MSSPILALRGHAITFCGNPFEQEPSSCLVNEPDALILMRSGKIIHFAAFDPSDLPPGVTPVHYRNEIISAGFIDTHVHYPQLEVIASYGEQLLEWLERYIFPAERKFSDAGHAGHIARAFLGELLRSGTTTACVYCTVHPQSVDAFFEESSRLNTLMIAGKVLMDRNAPDDLCENTRAGFDQSLELIGKWHGQGRQHYAVTPRFAPTSTPEQLELAAALLDSRDDLFLQTHISETRAEVRWVSELFPQSRGYLDVYDSARLVRPRTVLGHGVHLTDSEFGRCHDTGCAIAHCPTSNTFLGSGNFPLFEATDPARPVRVGLGTDMGAGTSLCQLRTLGEAYKVAQGQGRSLHPVQAFWLATAGSARALYLDDRIGTIGAGRDADLCILDPFSTPLLSLRSSMASSTEDQLFALMTLGDDRAIRATYVAGRLVHDRDTAVNVT